MSNRRINRFLLKPNTFVSANVYKRAILRGQLSLIGVSVGVIYTILDILNGLTVSLGFYSLLIALSMVVFLLNRSGRFSLANNTFLCLLLFLLYVFTDNDINRTGVSTYLIIYAMIALTLWGYEQIYLGLFFSALGLAAFFVAYYVDLPPLIQRVQYSEVYIEVSFITNFLVSFFVATALLSFSIDVNYKIEQELSANNQLLVKANRELDRFVYSASHDLRAPLSSLLGLIEISERTDNPEEIRYCLSLMKDRVNDLDAFIQEIIDYSRNARQELRMEEVLLPELIKEIVKGLKFGVGMEDVFIKYDVPLDLRITTDRSRLRVVLSNVIGNALKYSNPEHPEQRVIVRATRGDKLVQISIEDNGIGIGEEHLPRIFEMFYRASEKSQGSGLGLYIVKETLDKLNGKIHVTSQPGAGTRVTIELPQES